MYKKNLKPKGHLFSSYWKIILKTNGFLLQRVEEKEIHLNYSKEASAIKFKIKYPDWEI